MSSQLAIASISAGNGVLGICPIAGSAAGYDADLQSVLRWSPDILISLTEASEFEAIGAEALGQDLRAADVHWIHNPIRDFDAPDKEFQQDWFGISSRCRKVVNQGGRVLVHCRGGCGRSGMVVLRLMIELGEQPEHALARLRDARPCAVETPGQMAWAITGRVE